MTHVALENLSHSGSVNLNKEGTIYNSIMPENRHFGGWYDEADVQTNTSYQGLSIGKTRYYSNKQLNVDASVGINLSFLKVGYNKTGFYTDVDTWYESPEGDELVYSDDTWNILEYSFDP